MDIIVLYSSPPPPPPTPSFPKVKMGLLFRTELSEGFSVNLDGNLGLCDKNISLCQELNAAFQPMVEALLYRIIVNR
jgi:hypothetical protein